MNLWAVKEADGVRLRLVEREGWNGPLTELVDVVDHVADQLRGQCVHDLEAVLEWTGLEAYRDNQEFLQAVDAKVFLCETCGWWCGEDELADGNVCTDCAESEEEDED